MGKIVKLASSSMKAALLAYMRLLEVDKAAFPGLVDVVGENRYDKFFVSEITFINIQRASRS